MPRPEEPRRATKEGAWPEVLGVKGARAGLVSETITTPVPTRLSAQLWALFRLAI